MRTFRAPWASAWKKSNRRVYPAGFLFGVAGVIGAIRLGQGQIAIGDDKMFPAQAAVVVGGTSLAGGKGGVVNTIVGVLIMTVLDNGLVMLNVNPNIRTGVQGVIILVAVILTAARGAKVISNKGRQNE